MHFLTNLGVVVDYFQNEFPTPVALVDIFFLRVVLPSNFPPRVVLVVNLTHMPVGLLLDATNKSLPELSTAQLHTKSLLDSTLYILNSGSHLVFFQRGDNPRKTFLSHKIKQESHESHFLTTSKDSPDYVNQLEVFCLSQQIICTLT